MVDTAKVVMRHASISLHTSSSYADVFEFRVILPFRLFLADTETTTETLPSNTLPFLIPMLGRDSRKKQAKPYPKEDGRFISRAYLGI